MRGDDEHYRAPLLWLLVPYLAGLLAASAGWGGGRAGIAALATTCAILAIVVSAKSRRTNVPLWAVFLAAGAFLGGMVWMHRALSPAPRWRDLPPRQLVAQVRLKRVFPGAEKSTRRSCIAEIVGTAPLVDDLIGQRVYFSAAVPDGVSFVKTMRLEVSGVLVPLESGAAANGSFEAYLVSSAVRFKLTRTEVTRVTHEATVFADGWYRLGRRFESILRHGLPANHPATHAYVAMFLGRRSELATDQRDVFMRSGTMHLFAISGLHIGVIAYGLHAMLGLLRLPRRLAFVIGLVLLVSFVEATGSAPSARRALFMFAVLWAGHALRRPANPMSALVTSALFVLLVDPLAVLSTSFQLSYSVVAMILLYGIPLRNRWMARWKPFRFIPTDSWHWRHHAVSTFGREVLSLAAISVAASLVSLPLGIALFGLAAPGAVLSNIVVIPTAGFAVTAGLASLLCGLMGLLPLSTVFNHAGALILWLIEGVARIAAQLPGMYVRGAFDGPWIGAAIVIATLSLCLAGYAVRWRRPPGALWLPPVLVVTAVVLLVTPPDPAQESHAMKSAYELAMERLQKSDPDASPKLSEEQKAKLAEIDRIYQGKIAEREIFLKQRLAETLAANDHEEAEKVREQIKSERARLEEEREDEKNRVRKAAGGKA